MLLPQRACPSKRHIIQRWYISLSYGSFSVVLWPCEGVCSHTAWGMLHGVDSVSGVQVTLSLQDMNKGCSPYGEALTEETHQRWLLKNMFLGGCLLLKPKFYENCSYQSQIVILLQLEPGQSE